MEDTSYILDERVSASDRRRFVNCILDLFFAFVIMFVFSFIVIVVGNLFTWEIYSIWDGIIREQTSIVLLVFLLLNYLIGEWWFGSTFGKLITGTIVVDKKGQQPKFGVILKRTLCRLFPFDAFSFLGKSGRIWHDSLS